MTGQGQDSLPKGRNKISTGDPGPGKKKKLKLPSNDKTDTSEAEVPEKTEEPPVNPVPPGYFPYEPLSNGLIKATPRKLHYRKLDIYHTLKLGDFEYDVLDDNITDFLDSVCYESKTQGFSHVKMTEADRLHLMLYYIAKNMGVLKSNVSGVCPECNKIANIPELDLSKLAVVELDPNYREPWLLNLDTIENKKAIVGIRYMLVADLKTAESIVEKEKSKPNSPLQKDSEELIESLEKTYGIALCITQVDDRTDLSNEEKIEFYSKTLNHESRLLLAGFFEKFDYGTQLKKEGYCTQPQCPSIDRDPDSGKINKDPKTKRARRKMVMLTIPFQKSFFTTADSKKRTIDEVSIHPEVDRS